MKRQLRNSLWALASSAMVLAVAVMAASPLSSLEPATGGVQASSDGEGPMAPLRPAVRHGVSMPFFSFRPGG